MKNFLICYNLTKNDYFHSISLEYCRVMRKSFSVGQKDKWNTFVMAVIGNLFFCYCLITAIALILFSCVTIECEVSGPSMQPTLNYPSTSDSDTVYINIYDKDYNYGDIIVVNVDDSARAIIKRVVGLPGDIIDIVSVDGEYFLERNGEIVEEDYILYDNSISIPAKQKNGMHNTAVRFEAMLDNHGEDVVDGKYIVPEDSVFALGDNRAKSQDSSYYGAFSKENIQGIVELIQKSGESKWEFYTSYIVRGKFFTTIANML